MAISPTTDWSKMRYIMLVIFATSNLLASTIATDLATSGKQKRQLFREHLLPQQGGKIPESAFRADRLVLNRLNQNGYYSLDGVLIEQRQPSLQIHTRLFNPETLKIPYYKDNRYVSPYGRYNPETSHSIETSYLIRQPVRTNLFSIYLHQHNLPLPPYASLKLYHNGFRSPKSYQHSPWSEVFPPNNNLPQQEFEFNLLVDGLLFLILYTYPTNFSLYPTDEIAYQYSRITAREVRFPDSRFSPLN